MAKYFSAFVKRAGEQSFSPIAEGTPLYYGDTVKLKLGDDLHYGTASERLKISLKGVLRYSVDARIETILPGGESWHSAAIYQEGFTDTSVAEGAELVLPLNTPSTFALAAAGVTDLNGFKVRVICRYRAYCDKYLGGAEDCEMTVESQGFSFSFAPYGRTFTAELVVKNVWDGITHQLREGPFTVAQCAANGYEAVYNGTTLSRPDDSVKETLFRVTVREIAKSVVVGGQTATVASDTAVYVNSLTVSGPDLQFGRTGTLAAPLEGLGAETPVYDTGWQRATQAGDVTVALKDSTGQIHSATLPLFGTGENRIGLYAVGAVWFGNTEQITVERAAGADVNGAASYNSVTPAANTYIRISGITASLSAAVTALTLHRDTRANIRVFAALRTEGMANFVQETELTDNGDARGFCGVIADTSMTKAYFVRIRAVDCYGQEATVVKLTSAPVSEDFPTVFKAKAKTKEAEFWWPVSFLGGLKAVQMDAQSAQVNLSDRIAPGYYYTAGSLNGVNTQIVYESGVIAPYGSCILLVAGDGETERLQLIAHAPYTEGDCQYGLELRRLQKQGGAWHSNLLWRK